METSKQTPKVPKYSIWQKATIIMGSILFVIATSLLISPADVNYNQLIAEYQSNTDQWHTYEEAQDGLSTRNTEIRQILCEAGICDFQ